jgi:predicted O-methyltransferase YrrM
MKKKIYNNLIYRINSISNHINPVIRPSTLFIKDNLNNGNGLLIAEIGVDLGFNALTILRNLNIKKIYLIDPYPEYYKDFGNYPSGDIRYKKAKSRLKKYIDKIIFIKKNSCDAINDLPDDFDFIYIDGNHSGECVSCDLINYYPKVKLGGIIGGHDFVANFLGVCKAVISFTERNNLNLFTRDSDWWIVKER